MLYSMMSRDRRPDPGSGLLLYLRSSNMVEVPCRRNEERGLIQLRNQLVAYLRENFKKSIKRKFYIYFFRLPPPPLWSCVIIYKYLDGSSQAGKYEDEKVSEMILPEPIDFEKACSNCDYLEICSIYQKIQGTIPPPPHPMSRLAPGKGEIFKFF